MVMMEVAVVMIVLVVVGGVMMVVIILAVKIMKLTNYTRLLPTISVKCCNASRL